MLAPRKITRYKNRKLYDSYKRDYTNLAEILKLVAKGETFFIIDRITGQDIKDETIIQAMKEQGNLELMRHKNKIALVMDLSKIVDKTR